MKDKNPPQNFINRIQPDRVVQVREDGINKIIPNGNGALVGMRTEAADTRPSHAIIDASVDSASLIDARERFLEASNHCNTKPGKERS